MRVLLRIASAAVAIATLAIVTGCAKHLQSIAGLPNQPPTVSLTGAPLEAVKAERVAYALRWSGSDPDGRVDHYLVTDNPRLFAGTQGWARADETARVLALGRVAAAASVAAPNKLPEPTFFAVRAVDDQGAVSEPAIRGLHRHQRGAVGEVRIAPAQSPHGCDGATDDSCAVAGLRSGWRGPVQTRRLPVQTHFRGRPGLCGRHHRSRFTQAQVRA